MIASSLTVIAVRLQAAGAGVSPCPGLDALAFFGSIVMLTADATVGVRMTSEEMTRSAITAVSQSSAQAKRMTAFRLDLRTSRCRR